MNKKIDVRKIKTNTGLIELEVYQTKDKKEFVLFENEYYYLSKDGLKITSKKLTL